MIINGFLSAAIFVYIAAFLLDAFYPSGFLKAAMTGGAAAVILLAFHRLAPANRNICLALAAAGSYLLYDSRAGLENIFPALLQNVSIIVLLITVPLLSSILHFEPYEEYLVRTVPRHIKTSCGFYTSIFILMNLFSMLLNIASIPFVYNLFKGLAERYSTVIYRKALLRGVSANTLWSPSYISVAIVLKYTGLPWYKVAPVGGVLAAGTILTGLLLGLAEARKIKIEQINEHSGMEGSNKNYAPMLLFQMGLVIGLILGLEILTHKSALVTVPLVSLVGPLLLAVAFKRLDIFKARFREYAAVALPNKLVTEIIVFTSIGFFGYALGLSDIRNMIPGLARDLGLDSPASLIPALIAIISLLSVAGIHPVISISSIAITLPPGAVPVTELQMAGVFLGGYMLYAILSPFSGISLAFASVTGVDPVTLSLKQNALYAFLFWVVASVILVFGNI